MSFKVNDVVALNRDLPDHGLKKGDLGAVVLVYGSDGLEVEFVSATGQTEALLSLKESDVRTPADGDLMTVKKHRGRRSR